MQISVAEGLEDFDDDLAKGVGNDQMDGRMVPDPQEVPQKAQSPVQRFLINAAHKCILNTDYRCFNSLLRMPNGHDVTSPIRREERGEEKLDR